MNKKEIVAFGNKLQDYLDYLGDFALEDKQYEVHTHMTYLYHLNAAMLCKLEKEIIEERIKDGMDE